MKTFMVLYLATNSAEELMQNTTPEQSAEGMRLWEQWMAANSASIIDSGSPLGKGRLFTSSGSSDPQTTVAGYSIVQADDLDGVQAIVANHPHLRLPGTGIETLEMVSITS